MSIDLAEGSTSIPAGAPLAELEERLAIVRLAMSQLDVDVAVITAPQAVFHLSGIWTGSFGSAPFLIIAPDRARVVARRLDMGWQSIWSSRSWATNWIPYNDYEDPAEVAGRIAGDMVASGTPAIGLELHTALALERFVGSILRGAGAGKVVDLQPTMIAMRSIKSPTELDHIRRSAPITIAGFDAACKALSSSMSDKLAAAAAFEAMIEAGSEPFAYTPIVVSGSLNAAVHIPWAGVAPKSGQPTTVMLGGVAGGYVAPLERTFFRDRIPPRAQGMIASVVAAIENVMAHARPGMTGAEIDFLARSVHERNGFGDRFLHRTGYSIGINWADLVLMQLHPGEEQRLRAGMTFHLVPHLFDPEFGLLSVSQPILVTDSGCVPLQHYPLTVGPI